jgi:hypothetical protein
MPPPMTVTRGTDPDADADEGAEAVMVELSLQEKEVERC